MHKLGRLLGKLRRQLCEAGEDPYHDEVWFGKLPPDEVAKYKQELEKLGVKFIDEFEPGSWTVTGPRATEMEADRIKAILSGKVGGYDGIAEQLDDRYSDLQDAANDADWDYRVSSVSGPEPEVGVSGWAIEEVSDIKIEFTWEPRNIFTPEEILKSLDRWIAEKRMLSSTHRVSSGDDDEYSRRRSRYVEGSATVDLDSKNTHVVVKAPGSYYFTVSQKIADRVG